eukprot:scaffold107028_cov15-Tisochrysis_lutea.AAC.1
MVRGDQQLPIALKNKQSCTPVYWEPHWQVACYNIVPYSGRKRWKMHTYKERLVTLLLSMLLSRCSGQTHWQYTLGLFHDKMQDRSTFASGYDCVVLQG